MSEISIVDNNTAHLEALYSRLSPHFDVDVTPYHPEVVFDENASLYLLSGGGGEGQEANDTLPNGHLWHEAEVDLIRRTDKPVLGICMGHELVCLAHGAEVRQLAAPFIGWNAIRTSGEAIPEVVVQKNSQEWSVREAPKSLVVLATSPRGVEWVKDPEKPVESVQFHPELGGTVDLVRMVYELGRAA